MYTPRRFLDLIPERAFHKRVHAGNGERLAIEVENAVVESERMRRGMPTGFAG
jgi:hypothetical protein